MNRKVIEAKSCENLQEFMELAFYVDLEIWAYFGQVEMKGKGSKQK